VVLVPRSIPSLAPAATTARPNATLLISASSNNPRNAKDSGEVRPQVRPPAVLRGGSGPYASATLAFWVPESFSAMKSETTTCHKEKNLS
jgi:hypothetical protein